MEPDPDLVAVKIIVVVAFSGCGMIGPIGRSTKGAREIQIH